jgi:hypothetical protein
MWDKAWTFSKNYIEKTQKGIQRNEILKETGIDELNNFQFSLLVLDYEKAVAFFLEYLKKVCSSNEWIKLHVIDCFIQACRYSEKYECIEKAYLIVKEKSEKISDQKKHYQAVAEFLKFHYDCIKAKNYEEIKELHNVFVNEILKKSSEGIEFFITSIKDDKDGSLIFTFDHRLELGFSLLTQTIEKLRSIPLAASYISCIEKNWPKQEGRISDSTNQHSIKMQKDYFALFMQINEFEKKGNGIIKIPSLDRDPQGVKIALERRN